MSIKQSNAFKSKPKVIKHSLDMKIVTWVKDSHGLFDYESNSLQMKKYSTESTCIIYKQGKTD